MTCIGIDLGTTNSLAAVFQDGRAQLIPNALNETLTPSVVSIDDDSSILVGKAAKERLITHPNQTIANVKRQMGSRQVVRLGEQQFSPEEISAFILRSLKQDAEQFLNTEVTDAVISVPAYFNELQRRATLNAAKLAGLNVDLLINEPTAAALAYGIHAEKNECTCLVFDLGGGTFDVAIVDYLDGLMEVHASSGDNFLGGENFTEALLFYFCQLSGLPQDKLTLKEQHRLLKAIESLKIRLTLEPEVELKIKLAKQEYHALVNRHEFLEEHQLLVQRLKKPIARALSDAKFTASDLQEIILVGGATRMPFIREFLVKSLGIFPRHSLNPDEVVALGAAIQAGLKQNEQALAEVVLADVCPYTLGTSVAKLNHQEEIIGFRFLPIIQRNSKVPVSRTEPVTPLNEKQKVVELEILQGEHRNPENNVSLGSLEVKVPTNVKEWPPVIDVRYTYDVNGLLEVEATIQETGEKTSAVFQNLGAVMDDEEIQKRLSTLSTYKVHPRESLETRTMLASAEALYQELSGDQREYLESYVQRFEMAIESQNNDMITEAKTELLFVMEQLEPEL